MVQSRHHHHHHRHHQQQQRNIYMHNKNDNIIKYSTI